MNTNLYNHDGTLSTQAQLLLSPKPADMSTTEWRNRTKDFKSLLSAEELKEFKMLKSRVYNKTRYITNQKPITEDQKEYQKQYQQAYRQANKEKRKVYWKAYCEANKEERRAYMAEYARARRQKDPLYNFFQSIRSQAVRVVKQVGLGKKPTNTFKWVGCSPEELKAHIESLFLEGMTWDNYGRHGWHVDHIRPVSSFNPEEWEQINHYTNLQPLWAEDNLSKSNSY